jgi:hypothetical protein
MNHNSSSQLKPFVNEGMSSTRLQNFWTDRTDRGEETLAISALSEVMFNKYQIQYTQHIFLFHLLWVSLCASKYGNGEGPHSRLDHRRGWNKEPQVNNGKQV